LSPRYAPGRLKQWLAMLTRSYPEAFTLFNLLRRENDCSRIDALLGVDFPLAPTQFAARQHSVEDGAAPPAGQNPGGILSVRR
jgi:hypothetical protein